MLYNYSTSNLTGLQDLMIKKVDYLGNFLFIDAEIERNPHKCPCCGTITDKVHDYRVQTIKAIPYTNGFTEGCNNKIKALKRNAYGYRNFRRFRNRSLHIFNYKNIASPQEKEAV